MPRKMILVWISVHFYNVKHTTMIAKHVARSISRDFEFVNCASLKKKHNYWPPESYYSSTPQTWSCSRTKLSTKPRFKKSSMMHWGRERPQACYYAVIVSVLANYPCVLCSPWWDDHRHVSSPAREAIRAVKSQCQSWMLESSPVSVACSVPLTEPEIYCCVLVFEQLSHWTVPDFELSSCKCIQNGFKDHARSG